ncbi:hypothetical protein KSK55_11630 [Methanospirillum purgamenti]|jgi:hypothetical protein|uniref:Uncharacterized protein n=1 Tax=Methanospirillum hungatei TaxID=2203 RepID=A0A8F5VL15_METHU|nr:hypothetical protein [Methanospirillum hungatei]QXO93981.1 hypothetical protein KSK55_11630 [Methanospirillum hungatei]
MNILKRKRTSKCTSGALVHEYTLSEPVDMSFIGLLGSFGSVEKKVMGDLVMFTFQKDEWFTLKGMSDDPIFYTTCQKSDSKAAEEFIDNLLTTYNNQQQEDGSGV